MMPMDREAVVPLGEPVELIDHAHSPPHGGCDRRAHDTQLGKGSDAEDQKGIENHVADVGDPERPHRNRRVARPTENRVDQEEQKDDDVAAEQHPGVAGARGDDVRRGPHEPEQVVGEDAAKDGNGDGDEHAEGDRLHGGAGGAFGILLPDPSRHHRGGADTEAHAEGIDATEHRLGEPDGGDGAGSEPPDPEDVDHGKHRLERHLEHHRYREQHQRPPDGSGGVVVPVPAQHCFLDRGPDGRRRRLDFRGPTVGFGGGGRAGHASNPPSTTSTCPVTKELASLARKSAA